MWLGLEGEADLKQAIELSLMEAATSTTICSSGDVTAAAEAAVDDFAVDGVLAEHLPVPGRQGSPPVGRCRVSGRKIEPGATPLRPRALGAGRAHFLA